MDLQPNITEWLKTMPAELHKSLVQKMEDWLKTIPTEERALPTHQTPDGSVPSEQMVEHVRTMSPVGLHFLGHAFSKITKTLVIR